MATCRCKGMAQNHNSLIFNIINKKYFFNELLAGKDIRLKRSLLELIF